MFVWVAVYFDHNSTKIQILGTFFTEEDAWYACMRHFVDYKKHRMTRYGNGKLWYYDSKYKDYKVIKVEK